MNGSVEECMNFGAIICCSEEKHENIISNIIGSENLHEPSVLAENINGYIWHVETKYYTADIHLISLKEKNLVSSAFADNLQAVVIHFDNNKVDALNDVESWLPFIEHFSPQVQLLVCNNCSSEASSGLNRQKIIEWCLQRQFELVELHPDDTEDDEVEDDFKETVGYKRIIQALQAHSWSNLTMKELPTFQPSKELLSSFQNERLMQGHDAEGSESDGAIINESSNVENITADDTSVSNVAESENAANKIDSMLGQDQWIFEAMGQEDPGGESFEALFSKLLNMKEKAATLSGDERKLFAEKVTLEFWRAIGGDEEEIAGLCSDEN